MVAQLAEALRYKPGGRVFDSRWCHSNFSFRPHYGPGVDSAPNRNEYQEYFLGVKAVGAYGWQPRHLHMPIVLKSGSLTLLETSGPVQACIEMALHLHVNCYLCICVFAVFLFLILGVLKKVLKICLQVNNFWKKNHGKAANCSADQDIALLPRNPKVLTPCPHVLATRLHPKLVKSGPTVFL